MRRFGTDRRQGCDGGKAVNLEGDQAKVKRGYWRIVGVTLLVLIGGIVVAVAVAYAAGTVEVSVREKKPDGTRFHLIVPSLLITGGVRFVPGDELSRAATEIQPWLPAIRVASRELAHCPDATLVEIRSRDERVSVVKDGSHLVIDVEDAEDTVHLSLPLNVLTAVTQRLEAASPPV